MADRRDEAKAVAAEQAVEAVDAEAREDAEEAGGAADPSAPPVAPSPPSTPSTEASGPSTGEHSPFPDGPRPADRATQRTTRRLHFPARPRPDRRALAAAALMAALGLLGLCMWELRVDESPSGGDGRLLMSRACEPVVSMGQQDKCARRVQELLRRAGAKLAVDGNFGPETQRRVTAFQVLAGLPPRGIVDSATKKALYDTGVRMSPAPERRLERRIRAVFHEEPDKAVTVARCQSFLDPLHILPNTDGSRNWGLFQISDRRLGDLGGTPRDALDPEWNIRAAHRLWSRHDDFRDWPSCAKLPPDE